MNWTAYYYNHADEDFGFDCGPQIIMSGIDKSTAKSIARHYNKVWPEFIEAFAEEDDE